MGSSVAAVGTSHAIAGFNLSASVAKKTLLADLSIYSAFRAVGETVFTGYDHLDTDTTVLGLIVQLPVDATVYRIGDRVTITASVFDPALVGVVATVTALMHKTHATARRLVCEEVSA